MTTPSRQARLYTRRLRGTQRVQARPGRRADGLARSAAPLGEDTILATPGALALRRLANRIAAYAPHDGAFQLRLPGTWAIRLSRMTTAAAYTSLGPALCAAAQGAKVVMLGREVLEYDPSHLLVFAVDLPISTQVTRASRKDPYLGFTMDLDVSSGVPRPKISPGYARRGSRPATATADSVDQARLKSAGGPADLTLKRGAERAWRLENDTRPDGLSSVFRSEGSPRGRPSGGDDIVEADGFRTCDPLRVAT